MSFTSGIYIIFLAIVCLVAYAIPPRFRYIVLLIASYAFYLYDTSLWQQNLPALALMITATVISFFCAHGIQRASKQKTKRIFLTLSIITCLLMLLACKYTSFIFDSISNIILTFGGTSSLPHLNIVLPLGISYYTLQSISYAADVYLGTTPAEKNPLRYALYLSFFPSIVAGPINRAGEMLPQYASPKRFDYRTVAGGLFRVLWGLFKKLVIADNLGVISAAVLKSPSTFTGPQVILAVLIFTYQIYADFSGAADIAIGSARMLGFDFMENFTRPFAAKTYSGLWQRWHISLTSFFRDYVFTPLVWSRWTEKLPLIGKYVKKPPIASSTLIIFAISGLWHGASTHYIIWGLLNGCIMVFAKWFSKRKEKIVSHIPVYRAKRVRGFFQRIWVYLLFATCLVFFAAGLFNFTLSEFISTIAIGWNSIIPSFTLLLEQTSTKISLIYVLIISILIVEVLEKFGKNNIAVWLRKRPWYVRWPLYYILLIALILFGAFGQSAFIYQNY